MEGDAWICSKERSLFAALRGTVKAFAMMKVENQTIRKPKATEMSELKRLIDAASATGALLPRSLVELCEHMRDFFVYIDEDGVGGCCALHIDAPDLAEIRSLALREDLRGRGYGAKLLAACIEEARALGIRRVYALTRIPDFFLKYGFTPIDMHELPHKVFKDCVRCHLFPDCDEAALIFEAYPRRNGAEGAADEGVAP